MKTSLRVHLFTSKTYADNSHPVVLQYIIDRKVTRRVIARCQPSDWDKKRSRVKYGVENSIKINRYITTEFNKAESELYDMKMGTISPDSLFSKTDTLTLADVFKAELARYKSEDKSASWDKIQAMQRLVPDTSVALSDMTEQWFRRFISHLVEKGNGANTIKAKVNKLRGMVGRYLSSGVPREVKAIALPGKRPVKQKLTTEELARFASLPLSDGELITASRDLFLLQVYLRGIRIGDLLQAYTKDFSGGRFSYVSDKQSTPMTIKLIPAAVEIVERFRDQGHARLFPFFTWVPNPKLSDFENNRKRLKHKEACTAVVNAHLKILAGMAGIKKPLSSHIARHTFARMAIDKINNPMVTMELLGHTSLAVHQGYLNDIRKDDELDKAADDIFS